MIDEECVRKADEEFNSWPEWKRNCGMYGYTPCDDDELIERFRRIRRREREKSAKSNSDA